MKGYSVKKWFKTLAATCAIVPLAQCAMLPGNNLAHAREAAAPATTAAVPALWSVADADTTIYLFGTVHVLKPGLGWFDHAVKEAFDTSDEMILELVMPESDEEAAQAMIPMAIEPSGRTIPSRLDADALAAYRAALADLGIPTGQFDNFKPWFPAVMLSVLPLTKLGYDPNQGVEKQLTAFAKATKKPISGFETLPEQLGFFDALAPDQQVAFLNAVVKDIDELGPTLDRLVDLWAKGDPENLAVVMNESMAATPQLTKILLWDRNARWADQIKARMDKPGTVFVAVGAGHLAGAHSVQDYLAERGLRVTRVEPVTASAE